jgi:phenylacetate-CoA ligase
VNVFPSEVEDVVLKIEEVAPHYQLVVSKDGVMDKLTLEVEVSEKFVRHLGPSFSLEHESCGKLSGRLRSLLKDVLGVSTEVVLREPRSIPRSEGKAVRVIDRRNPVGIKG